MHRPLRWLIAGLLYSLADRVAPPIPDDAGRDACIRAGVMDAIAADHGAGMARRQLAAAEMAKHMALGDRADVGGRRETPITTKRLSND